MTFDSREFLIFFAVFFAGWLLVRHADRPIRNGFLLLASYYFYGSWSLQFLGLLMLSTVIDYVLGQAIYNSADSRRRKQLVGVSVAVNLGILGFFKYFNFFIDSAIMMLPEGSFAAPALKVILPVGISFYTFQSLSYTIDVYRKNIKPADSLLDFALYVAFFPQLVAGPIERAANMLPQFVRKPQMLVERSLDGFDLCIRGFFKKVVIADNVAPLVNFVFADVDGASGVALWIACYAFAVQIYADFSGYTDIARGTSKLLGFELMENFRSPYGSLNVTEFWRRWHISLSTWFRDYLYVPMVKSAGGGRFIRLRSLFLVMAIAGLWHGAAWHFVLWGLFHGMLLVVHTLAIPLLWSVTSGFGRTASLGFKVLSWFVTFHLWVISVALFRAEDLTDSGIALRKMFMDVPGDLRASGLSFIPNTEPAELLFYVVVIAGALLTQFINFDERFKWTANPVFRGARGALTLGLIAVLYPTVKEQFIYFQF